MSDSDVIYRQAVEEDVKGILTVVRLDWPRGTPEALEQRDGVIGGRPWQDYQVDAIRSSVEAHLDTCLVAEVQGNVVGWAVWTVDHGKRIGSVANTAVHPDFRGRGIGTEIVKRALDKLRLADMRIAMAGTGLGDEHAPARRVYEKVGFRTLRQSVQYSMEL